MKVAIPTWRGRVSPVFDVARTVLIIETVQGDLAYRREHPLRATDPSARARELAALGVETVVCGALSRPLRFALQSFGIEVLDRRCGPVESVWDAFASGLLRDDTFLMPGCRCGGGFGRGRGGRRHRGGAAGWDGEGERGVDRV